MESVLDREAPQLLRAARRPRGDEHLLARRERAHEVRGGLGRAAVVAGDGLGRKADRRRGRSTRPEAIEPQARRLQSLPDAPGRVDELLRGEGVAVGIAVRLDAL